MRVLVACEFSGVVREAFAARGHDAWSCDLLPTEIPGQHVVGDARDLLIEKWDLLIAHPPCTYLANSGVRWLYNEDGTQNQERWEKIKEGAEFFRCFLNASVPKRAIENPIMHGWARRIIISTPTQIIQPWQFGHGETKATGFWLRNLPKLLPTNIVAGRCQRVAYASPSPDRWKERSRTLKGIAEAMADQWGTA